MRMASWQWGGREHVGIISADGREATPLALADASRGVLPLIQMLMRGEPLPSPCGARLPLEVLTLRAPLPRPIVFGKLPECVIGPFDAVQLPATAASVQIDYESELAVVIGRGGRDIARSRAMDHVFGYTIVNDVTARDVQMRHQQWDLGKSFDTFCPMGPWIVTADEMDGRATRVRGWVTPKGASTELRQDGLTKDMIHDLPTLIETCSRGITLYPGDVIATGTPAGVGMGLKPPQWLKAGDVVRIEIDGIGVIENRFK